MRSCRLADRENAKQHDEEWRFFQPIFESGLERSNNGEYEFVSLISYYLPNFLYMSKDWTLSKLSEIFDQSNDLKWIYAMQAYAYVHNLYDVIYDHLKNSGDFNKALDQEGINKSVLENTIKNAIIFYMIGHEDIDDENSLISILLKRNVYDELHYIIWHVWTLHDREIENLRDRVYVLWDKLLNIIQIDNIEGKKLASQLCRWIIFVDKIDIHTKKWILKIAPYSEVDYNSHDLLKGLATLSETQPSEVFEIWLKMLDSYHYPYPNEAIEQIQRNLLRLGKGGERMVVSIIDAYLKFGEDKPRIIYSKIKNADNTDN